MSYAQSLGWIGIVRMGLVQMALGAIIAMTTSALNRIMVVEIGLLATVPGALVGIHYAVQVLRPRWGYGSDVGGRRTPWIVGGMAVLASGSVLACVATVWMADAYLAGLALSIFAFLMIGGGVGAAGTSLLVLLAVRVDQRRRPAAATIVWLMMIAGIAVTATVAGGFIDPYTPSRLIAVFAAVSVIAFTLTVIAIWGVEGPARHRHSPIIAPNGASEKKFLTALSEVWNEPTSRRFAIFVFVSMLAYSAQDLILEPFAGIVFDMTPGQSTKLAGLQHAGVFLGMVMVAVLGTGFGRGRFGSMRSWAVGGCFASAAALAALAVAPSIGDAFPIRVVVFILGMSNGAFAVAAIGSMMGLASSGKEQREGTRMGLWGAAQGIAFGVGGFSGTVALDAVRLFSGSHDTAFASVFALESALFVLSAYLAANISRQGRSQALGLESGAPTI